METGWGVAGKGGEGSIVLNSQDPGTAILGTDKGRRNHIQVHAQGFESGSNGCCVGRFGAANAGSRCD